MEGRLGREKVNEAIGKAEDYCHWSDYGFPVVDCMHRMVLGVEC